MTIDWAKPPHGLILVEGRNGSGKTTLLRSITGLAPGPRFAWPAPYLALQVGYVPQDALGGLIGLTVREEHKLRTRSMQPEIVPLADRDVAGLAGGEVRRVAISASLGPALWVLDEPFEGLDAAGIAWLKQQIQDAAKRGTVVAADPSGQLEKLANYVVTLGTSTHTVLPVLPKAGDAFVFSEDHKDDRGASFPAVAWGAGFHVIAGRNGSGKSTWLEALCGLRKLPVAVVGHKVKPGRDADLLVAHAGRYLLRHSVEEELQGTPEVYRELFVNVDHARHPQSLSGGEAQRIALAMAFGSRAPLLLLDEPEAHLDGDGRTRLAQAIAQKVSEGTCVVAATHDPEFRQWAHTMTELA